MTARRRQDCSAHSHHASCSAGAGKATATRSLRARGSKRREWVRHFSRSGRWWHRSQPQHCSCPPSPQPLTPASPVLKSPASSDPQLMAKLTPLPTGSWGQSYPSAPNTSYQSQDKSLHMQNSRGWSNQLIVKNSRLKTWLHIKRTAQAKPALENTMNPLHRLRQ